MGNHEHWNKGWMAVLVVTALVLAGAVAPVAGQTTLTISVPSPGDHLGSSVSVDGDVAIAGTLILGTPSSPAGRVYMYRFDSGSGSCTVTLIRRKASSVDVTRPRKITRKSQSVRL